MTQATNQNKADGPVNMTRNVIVTGRINSGKTCLFDELERCFHGGHHGFCYGDQGGKDNSKGRIAPELLQWESDGQNAHSTLRRQNIREAGQNPPGTLQVQADTYRLRLGPAPDARFSEPGEVELIVKIVDTRGEDSITGFVETDGIYDYDFSQKAYLEELRNAVGVVYTLSPYRISAQIDGQSDPDLIDAKEIQAIRSSKVTEKVERICIVLTMLDALLLPFRGKALDIVMDRTKLLTVLASYLERYEGALRTLSKTAVEGGNRTIDVRICATSSFGIEPRFGCVNLAIMQDADMICADRRPTPLPGRDPDRPRAMQRTPILVADPFIFAASGRDNPFIFTLDEMIRKIVALKDYSVPSRLKKETRA